MAEHPLTWTAPAPFWEGLAAAPAEIRDALPRPEILRFASDSFMDELLAALSRDPNTLRGLAAKHETWRGPEEQSTGLKPEALQERPPALALKLTRLRLNRVRRASAPVPAQRAKANGGYRLKLYQPVHQRYYLVSACLVCGILGFPDREVDLGQQERVGFLLRRLLPRDTALLDPAKDLPPYDPEHPEDWDEYAFVAGATGQEWRKVPKTTPAPLEGEERLPLFPTVYAEENERKRRLFSGLIPAGRRDAYMGARPQLPAAQVPAAQKPVTSNPRIVMLYADVLGPWKALGEQVGLTPASALLQANDEDDADYDGRRFETLKAARAQIQTASWYLLLDLAKYLQSHVRDVWATIAENAPRPTDAAKLELLQALESVRLSSSRVSLSRNLTQDLDFLRTRPGTSGIATVVDSLPEALKRILSWETALEGVTRPFDFKLHSGDAHRWPDFVFLFADPWYGPVMPNLPADADLRNTPIERELYKLNNLAVLFDKALDPLGDAKVPAPTPAAAGDIDMREGWFVIRCVYERPECGPLHDAVVSAPTRAFQLASFFDPDAPARPLRIGLPIDTTPAGLRKFDKKAAFVMSDILCGQLDRMKGIGLIDLILHVLPWPLHKGLSLPEKGPCVSGGTMCSFSIPIVTLCALILLMIIVSLLDFVFRWMPWLMVCFPFPGLRGKR